MAQWKCQIKRCQNLLPWEDSRKYRLRYLKEEQVEALPAKVQKTYFYFKGKNLCENCARLAREVGLPVVTVAQIKEWRRQWAMARLQELIGDDELEGLEELKADLHDKKQDEGPALQVVK